MFVERMHVEYLILELFFLECLVVDVAFVDMKGSLDSLQLSLVCYRYV